VHILGGTAGLAGAIALGARTGRYDEYNEKEFDNNNISYIVMGTIILWFGWYGFNCGSTGSVIGDNVRVIGLIGVNTSIAASAGLLASLSYNFYLKYT
jgi:Amt family ammonium transporter